MMKALQLNKKATFALFTASSELCEFIQFASLNDRTTCQVCHGLWKTRSAMLTQLSESLHMVSRKR